MKLFDELKAGLENLDLMGGSEATHLESEATEFAEHLGQHLAQYPEPIFALLRRLKPVFIVKNFALITRFDDVQDVLARDDVFSVTYGEKMRIVTGGEDFFLGMQNSPEYERDVAHMRIVIRRTDIPGIVKPLVAATAKGLVEAAGGSLDVVSGLGRVVPTRLIDAYFGCTPESENDLARWASTLFQFLFNDLKNDPLVGAQARDAAAHVRDWLDRLIAKAAATDVATRPDTVLTRCLALAALPGMDPVGIRNNLLGLLVGEIPTTSKCCAQALDELLKRPEALDGAQAAARAGDDATFAQYVFEALRFNPNNPGVFRVAAQKYVVGKGQPHETAIPAGFSVLAATQSAMFDELRIDKAADFHIGRPAWNYRHWGSGLHTCFGQYINQVQIPEILKPLLQRKNLRRADGDAGMLQYEGPFPSSLKVRFD